MTASTGPSTAPVAVRARVLDGRAERGRPAARAVPVVLAAAAITAQVVYPLVGGQARDAVTIATVVAFSAASLSHAVVHHGWRVGVAIGAVFAGGGLAVELLGVATGFPFGDYAYDQSRLGPTVGEVPLVIPLAWTMLGYPALVVARLTASSRLVGTAVGAIALAAWDLFLDPQMVAEGYWRWSSAGPHLLDGIPATNYAAWLGTAWLMMMASWHLTGAWTPDRVDLRVPVALYVWTWAGSALAHAAFFDLPQSALYGGVGMGVVVVAALVRTRTRPDGT
ncbi:carotenoid biosynthesis protein [Euzebya sp.]|uniref:carotenoid biosynthesis protein n=1 Tax=Euzebya sp. TaxID=1971409 RepID=UPI0035184F11